MSVHLQRFIERLEGLEARGAKDFTMPMSDAKGMHSDLTILLLQINNLKEAAVAAREDEVISVKMEGGSF
jgi:hypothetical protein